MCKNLDLIFDNTEKNIGKTLTKLLNENPTIILVGAGMSITTGLPNANNFVGKVIESIFKNSFVTSFFESFPSRKENWKINLMNLEFDSILGILKILDVDSHGQLFSAFLHGSQTQDYAYILRLSDELNIKAIFSTNFDNTIEKTAQTIGVKLKVFDNEKNYPDELIQSKILPLFKIHGGVSNVGNHSGIQADFSKIAREINKKRLGLLKKYLKDHNLLVLGYGGKDYWDIYPLLCESDTKSIFWISHENNDFSVLSSTKAKNLTRKRDNIERLLTYSSGGIQIKGNTQAIIKSMIDSIGIEVETVDLNINSKWEVVIENYYQNQENKAIIDLANLIASCNGGLNLAHNIFDFIIKTKFENLTFREKITSLLGRARTTINPSLDDLELAEDMSRKRKDDITLVLALLEKAIAIGNMGNRELAIKLLSEACRTAFNNESYSLSGLCYANIGHQYSKLKKFNDSDDAYSKSEELLRTAGNIPELFITLRNHAEMFAIDWADISVLHKALPLYLEALSVSWNRKLNDMYKIEMYSRIIVIFKLTFSSFNEVAQYLDNYSNKNKSLIYSGLGEHIINRIAKYGYEMTNLEMEEWEY